VNTSSQILLVPTECIKILDDLQLLSILVSLSSKNSLSIDLLPCRLIAQRIESSTDVQFKRNAVNALKKSPWGRTLIIESKSPFLASNALEIAIESRNDDGRLGASALALLARTALAENHYAEGWTLYCAALNRIDTQSIGQLKSIAKLIDSSSSKIAVDRTLRLAILGSTTTHYLAAALKMECAKIGVKADIYQSPHGSFRQDILDPHSGLYSFAPEIVYIWNQYEDLNISSTDDIPQACEELKQLWSTLLTHNPCRVIQNIPYKSDIEASGMLTWSHNRNGEIRLRQNLVSALGDVAPSSVWFFDMLGARISSSHCNGRWEDRKDWYTLQQSPSLNALATLASSLRSLIQASMGLTKKLLILDLDNTLWGGVVGEDGTDGILIGLDSPIARAYTDFQTYLRELKRRGVILAVSSKNNEADAKSPFVDRADLPLKLTDFAAFEANWECKTDSIKKIIRDINVGIDSVVFIDDNPLERMRVRAAMPEIGVPSMPPDPANYIEAIHQALFFESYRVSDQDLTRIVSYQANSKREEARAQSSSIDDYLHNLKMRCQIENLSPQNVERVYQLIHKTNQFNLTNRRHSEAVVHDFIVNNAVFSRTYSLSDKFGPHGLIGVLIAKRTSPDKYEIDTWLMSCRVLGRQMESFMMDDLVQFAQRNGINTIVGTYIQSKKNELVKDLLEKMGFQHSSDNSPEMHFDVPNKVALLCDFIATEESTT
jgi:FkbH-like protein